MPGKLCIEVSAERKKELNIRRGEINPKMRLDQTSSTGANSSCTGGGSLSSKRVRHRPSSFSIWTLFSTHA